MERRVAGEKAADISVEPLPERGYRVVDVGGAIVGGQRAHVFEAVQRVEVHVSAVVAAESPARHRHAEDAVDHFFGRRKRVTEVLIDWPDVCPAPEALDIA